jgi:hypothetical protein
MGSNNEILLTIVHVDEEFIENLSATAPDGASVETQKFIAFGASGVEADCAGIKIILEAVASVGVSVFSAWLYDAIKKQFAKRPPDEPKVININHTIQLIEKQEDINVLILAQIEKIEQQAPMHNHAANGDSQQG